MDRIPQDCAEVQIKGMKNEGKNARCQIEVRINTPRNSDHFGSKVLLELFLM